MIDGIKANISYLPREKLLNNLLLEWSKDNVPLDLEGTSKGKRQYPYTEYHGFKIEMKGQIWGKGSLQKYKNSTTGSGLQNYDDFTLADTICAIDKLSSDFGIVPESTLLTRLEYGVNVIVPFDPEHFLDNIIVWDYQAPTINQTVFTGENQKGYYLEFKSSEYSIKIYYKSKQYGIEHTHRIIRFEKKVKRRTKIRTLGIDRLSDLLYRTTHDRLRDDLIKELDKFIHIDSIQPPEAMNENERVLFLQWSNAKFWEQFPYHRNKKGKHVQRFRALAAKYRMATMYRTFCHLVGDQSQYLISGERAKGNILYPKEEQDEDGQRRVDLEIVCGTAIPKRTYGKRSPEEVPRSDMYAIKKVRNDESNPRHNLWRRVTDRVCKWNNEVLLFGPKPHFTFTQEQVELLMLLKEKDMAKDVFPFITYEIVKPMRLRA